MVCCNKPSSHLPGLLLPSTLPCESWPFHDRMKYSERTAVLICCLILASARPVTHQHSSRPGTTPQLANVLSVESRNIWEDGDRGPSDTAKAAEEAERRAQPRFEGRPAQSASFKRSGSGPCAGNVRFTPRPGIGVTCLPSAAAAT